MHTNIFVRRVFMLISFALDHTQQHMNILVVEEKEGGGAGERNSHQHTEMKSLGCTVHFIMRLITSDYWAPHINYNLW